MVFFLTDGQMELVSPSPDFAFFEAELPGLSYVLIGHNALPYLWYWIRPSLNWSLGSFILRTPSADAAKVRMYELLGADLQRYGTASRPGASLMYPWTSARAGPGIPDGRSLGVLCSRPARTGNRSTDCCSAVNRLHAARLALWDEF